MLKKEEKASIIKEFAKNEKDCGSAEVQIAILTKEINTLTASYNSSGNIEENNSESENN